MTDDLPRTLKSCPVTTNEDTDPDRNILIVPDKPRDRLTDKEFIDYHEYRKQFLTYLLQFGRDESKALGYSPYTIYADHHRSGKFDRWLCTRYDGYHVPPTEEDAKMYMEEVALSDKSQTAKGKILENETFLFTDS